MAKTSFKKLLILSFMVSSLAVNDEDIIDEYIADKKSNLLMKLSFNSKNDHIIACKVFPLKQLLKHRKLSMSKIHLIEHGLLAEAASLCSHFTSNEISLSNLKYPGTKWCGVGTSAKNINELGTNKLADACCRDHDFCSDVIRSGYTKHGLHNSEPETISHCNCDAKFYRCLKSNTNDNPSKIISKLYFDVLRMRCFKQEHPIRGCLKRKNLPICQEYQLDYSKPKIYQLFDSAHFASE